MKSIIKFIAEEFLCGMGLSISYENGETITCTPSYSETDEGHCWIYSADGLNCNVNAVSSDGGTVFMIDLKSDMPLSAFAARFPVDLSKAQRVLASHMEGPWWTMYNFPTDGESVKGETHNILLQKDDDYIALSFLIGDVYCAEADSEGLSLNIRCDGYTSLAGPILSAYSSISPFSAIKGCCETARNAGGINVPLRDERDYPSLFESFGWCSWNAFYQDVTARGLYSKMEEFCRKEVPVKWIIIDDGWSLVRDGMLASFDADPVKFPDGLDGCIRRLKDEFGIEGVGVWHTINGYWQGIDPTSEIAEKYADCLMYVKDGRLVPSTDPDKAFPFWDGFHSHLAESGVDFVKVDNQSSVNHYFRDVTSTVSAAVGTHEAIEESIIKNFGGKVINCMGVHSVSVLSRPFTAISRNSDDFFPNRENGFSKHLRQNLYSALWHSAVYFCDYDMWWSGKSAPVQSGVLRSISGGPVYISDAVGDTDLSMILPVAGNDGNICRMDFSALPTEDCLFCNTESSGSLQKVFNSYRENIALAVFNLNHEKESITESFSPKVIPLFDRKSDYICYEYFSKSFTRINADSNISVTLDSDGVLAYSLYPVKEDAEGEYIYLGSTDRYFGISTPSKKTYLSSIM